MGLFTVSLIISCCGVAFPLHAHVIEGSLSTFSAGLTHPFLGLDHLMAIFLTGLWASRKNKNIYLISFATVVGCMFVGAALGYWGKEMPLIEKGIAVSVAILGGVLLSHSKNSDSATKDLFICFLIGCIFMLHGYAHGPQWHSHAEEWSLYIIGLLMGTSLIFFLSERLGFYINQHAFYSLFYRASGLIGIGAGYVFLRAFF